MEKEGDAKERKPLSVMELMDGWGEGLIGSDGKIIFTVTEDTFASYQPQVQWIKNYLHLWIGDIIKEAGVMVVEANVKVGEDYLKYESSKVKNVSIVLKLSIQGLLLSDKIKNEEMRRLISGGLKKTLARNIIDNFPPSFDVKNPKFSQNVQDVIKFNTTSGQNGWKVYEIRRMNDRWTSIIQPAITEILMHKAVLKSTFRPTVTIGGPIGIRFEYLEESTLKDRRDLIDKLGKFFKEQDISCRHFE